MIAALSALVVVALRAPVIASLRALVIAALRAPVIAALPALVIVALPAPARAEEWRGGGSLALDLRYAETQPDTGDSTRTVTAGPRARAAAGKSALALAVGLDLRLGATSGGHFAYELNVMPFGFALLLGRSARLGAIAGFGTSGITGGVVPIALALPIEAFVELSLGDHLRLASWARATELAGAEVRESGAPDAPFGDDLEIGATLRWDRRRSDHGFVAGNGYQLGATVGQAAGAEVFSLSLGYSLDAAYPGEPSTLL
jgi:hypothetical protein